LLEIPGGMCRDRFSGMIIRATFVIFLQNRWKKIKKSDFSGLLSTVLNEKFKFVSEANHCKVSVPARRAFTGVNGEPREARYR
jgi:hypothetical protein